MPADPTKSADYSEREDIDLRGLIRLAGWGAAAACALMLAVFATRSEPGIRRLASVFGATPQQTAGVQIEVPPMVARTAELEFETRQMAVALRSLSADRDRLLARVTVLERNLDDVTGSISRAAARPVPAEQPGKAEALPKIDAAPKPEAPQTTQSVPAISIGPSVVATISSPLIIPTPSQEALARVGLPSIPTVDDENTATRTEFGVDLGHAPTVASLRTAWSTIRRNHGELFEGLYPVIMVRDGTKPGAVELRLIIGPLGNAAAAARLCGKAANAGLSCQPAIFNGQRLALR